MDIELKLTVDEINIMLNALGEQSYIRVAPIIQKIHEQARPQIEKLDKDIKE